MEEANKLIGAGKRHLVMGDPVAAVNVLQDACAMLAKTYGDTADECGEAFFLCGKALLELARMENSVLGNALEGVPEEEEEDGKEEKPKDSNIESTDNVDEKTKEELRVQVYDAMAEEEKKEEKKSSGKEEGVQKEELTGDKKGDGKEGEEEKEGGVKEEVVNGHVNGTASPDGEEEAEEEEEEEEKGENGSKVEEESSEPVEEEEEGGEGMEEEEGDKDEDGEATAEKDSDDEEVGNLQLAWEMLEVAKVIYKRKESVADQLLAAQVHLKLGEVAAESANYPQALEDFQTCLELQLKHLPSDSRLLAETHCQLGLTFTLAGRYREAVEQFTSSTTVIHSRLAKLQKAVDGAEGPEAVAKERQEMEELRALLPDIQEKVEDASEGLKTLSAAAEGLKEALGRETGASPFPAPSAQNGATTVTMIPVKSASGSAASVCDISHLVRKKRKAESPVKEEDSKKVRPEAHVNGSAENGSAENGSADSKTNGV